MRRSRAALAAFWALGAGCALVAAAAGPASAATQPWGSAREVPGFAALNTGNDAVLDTVSCGAPGDCAAGGYYFTKAGSQQAFVVTETGGSWGKAQQLPGTAKLNAGGSAVVNSVSCAARGDCVAGGYYSPGAGINEAFVATETGGTWGKAQEVPGTAKLNVGEGATVSVVSCAKPGDCSAGGNYTNGHLSHQPFVVTETAGKWGTAEELPGIASLNTGTVSQVLSISCALPGDCTAVGQYEYGSADATEAFVAAETGGTWGHAEELPGIASLATGGTSNVTAVSCVKPGDCVTGGHYETANEAVEAFVSDEANGTWGTPQQVPGTGVLNTGGTAWLEAVSCTATGDCSAGGFYYSAPSVAQSFVVDETNGKWGDAEEVAGSAALNTGPYGGLYGLSCWSPGNCSADGSFSNDSAGISVFVVNENGGTWGTAEPVPGMAALNVGGDAAGYQMSCARGGGCATGGYYQSKRVSHVNFQTFVVNRPTATKTSLALSAPKVRYGDEKAERLSVTVAGSGGDPNGTVTVTAGHTTVCTIKVNKGNGSCRVPDSKFSPGTVMVIASYRGDAGFSRSASTAKSFTVTK